MSAHEFSEKEILAIGSQFPNLSYKKNGMWEGSIEFDRIYRDYRIIDSYQIRIFVPIGFPNNFPFVYEIGDRIRSTATKYNMKIIADLHYNENQGACLCVLQERPVRLPPGSSFEYFIENLVIPYFYALSFFNEQGKWPWKEYAHGGLGVLEHYSENYKEPTETELRELSLVFLNDKLNLKQYRKQFIKPRPQRPCICGSGKEFSKCHSKACNGLELMVRDLKRFKIYPYKLFSLKRENVHD